MAVSAITADGERVVGGLGRVDVGRAGRVDEDMVDVIISLRRFAI